MTREVGGLPKPTNKACPAVVSFTEGLTSDALRHDFFCEALREWVELGAEASLETEDPQMWLGTGVLLGIFLCLPLGAVPHPLGSAGAAARGASFLYAFSSLSRVVSGVGSTCSLLLGKNPVGRPPEEYFWTLGLKTSDLEGTVLDVGHGISQFAAVLNLCAMGTPTRGLSFDPFASQTIPLKANTVDLAVANGTMATFYPRPVRRHASRSQLDSYRALRERGDDLLRDMVRVTRRTGRIVFNLQDLAAENHIWSVLEPLKKVGALKIERPLNPFNGMRFVVEMRER